MQKSLLKSLKSRTWAEAMRAQWSCAPEVMCGWMPCQETYRRPANAAPQIPTIDYALRLTEWSTARGEHGAVLLCPVHTRELIEMEREDLSE